MSPAAATFANPRPAMPAHISLVGHCERRLPGGVAVNYSTLDYSVDGATVRAPILFESISDHLAVAPMIVVDGDALRIDLTRWQPLRHDVRTSVLFVLAFTGRDVAVRVARALEADPRASWHWPVEDAMTWCRLHADRLGVRL